MRLEIGLYNQIFETFECADEITVHELKKVLIRFLKETFTLEGLAPKDLFLYVRAEDPAISPETPLDSNQEHTRISTLFHTNHSQKKVIDLKIPSRPEPSLSRRRSSL